MKNVDTNPKDPLSLIMGLNTKWKIKKQADEIRSQLCLMTITDPNVDPETVILNFYKPALKQIYTPYYTYDELSKMQQNFIQNSKKLEDEDKDLKSYAKKRQLIYDSNTNTFGHFENKNSKISDYFTGTTGVIPTNNGEFVNQSKKVDIDWEKLATIHGNLDFPIAFISKDGQWHHQDTESDANNSLYVYEKKWKDNVKEASDDDIFTHWIVEFIW